MSLPVLSLTFTFSVLHLSHKVIKTCFPCLCFFLLFPFCPHFQILSPDLSFSKYNKFYSFYKTQIKNLLLFVLSPKPTIY